MEVMTQKITFELAEEILTEYLSESRKRKTPERILILKEICELSEPFRIKEIADIVGLEHFINISTVQQAIRLFWTAKIIKRSHFREGDPLNKIRYELVER